MAIKLTSSRRIRTVAAAFSDSDLPTAIAAYNAYEVAQSEDGTKTISTRIVNSFFDGSDYVIIAESSYPEYTEDPTGQVPELP